MVLVINALDNQFAASTDGNVNSGAGTSTFDYPPQSTNGLTITSNEGDPSPYIFSPGDTYDISFGGNGGTTLEDAQVVRSDYITSGGDEGHAVIFEGTDPSGDLVQVVWTPEFDLEGWYWDNFSGGNPPGFYNSDTNANSTYQMVCFASGMRLETPDGTALARDLRAGDVLETYDNGPQEIQWVGQATVAGWGRHAPVVFEPGSIGNTRKLVLSQQHRLLFEVPEGDQQAMDHKEQVLVPAVAFVNGRDVRVERRGRISYVHFLMQRHEILSCAGVSCESLFVGNVSAEILLEKTRSVEEQMAAPALFADMKPARRLLSVREGAKLIARTAGQNKAPQKHLLSPGRKQARAYVLNPFKGEAQRGLRGMPAFASIEERAAR